MAPSVDVIRSPDFQPRYLDSNILDSRYATILDPNKVTAPKVTASWPLLFSPISWAGSDFVNENEYIYELSKLEILEITSALRHFQGLNLGVEDVKMKTFPLPNLKLRLAELGTELFDGKGFFILRGLDPQFFTVEENTIISLGVSSYIHEDRTAQNSKGQMIRHIIDADWTGVPAKARPSGYSNHAQYFHTDFACDVLVMYAVNTAAKGGNSTLASGCKIYNELAKTRPDVLELLARHDWATEDNSADKPYIDRSILYLIGGKVMFNIERRTLLGAPYAPRPLNIPQMTKPQTEALDLLQNLAEKYQISTTIRRGDMRFINNYSVLHSRDSFKDEGTLKRHLIRLWLQRGDGEVGWDLPEDLRLIIESRSIIKGGLMKPKWNPGLEVTPKEVIDQARETCDGGSATKSLSSIESLRDYAKKIVTNLISGVLTHWNSIKSAVFSPNSKQAVSGSWDGTMRLWDVATGAALQMFKSHCRSQENARRCMQLQEVWYGNVPMTFSISNPGPELLQL